MIGEYQALIMLKVSHHKRNTSQLLLNSVPLSREQLDLRPSAGRVSRCYLASYRVKVKLKVVLEQAIGGVEV
jgi:hypothetical protein